MQPYEDEYLESLRQVYEKNPDDINFKKLFALELFKRKQLKDAYKMLLEVSQTDTDLNISKALNEIKTLLSDKDTNSMEIGFTVVSKTTEDILGEIKLKKDLVTFAEIAGMDSVKEEIRTQIIYPFQHPEMYAQYNKKAGGGILLYGPPGCGKTYIARATAGEINANFIILSIHELLSAYSGEAERNLHYTFEYARSHTPAVIFCDEIDAIGMSRSKTSGNMRTLVNQFLVEMDGITSNNENILIIGATNLPWEVDSALRRPGRFDKVVFVTPPDEKARGRMFEINLKDKPSEVIDFEILAKLTKGFSSADIKKIINDASDKAFKEAVKTGKVVKVSQKLLEECIAETKSTITDWFSTVKNYIQYSNESGLYNDVKDYLDLNR